jgi:hypothetical protein
MNVAFSDRAIDITAPEIVQIQIKEDGKVVWINTEEGNTFRACQIKNLELVDDRNGLEKLKEKLNWLIEQSKLYPYGDHGEIVDFVKWVHEELRQPIPTDKQLKPYPMSD